MCAAPRTVAKTHLLRTTDVFLAAERMPYVVPIEGPLGVRVEDKIVLTNIAMARVGSVLVTCLGISEPSDQEVEQMIKRFAGADFDALLFSARSGGPNSKQRARIAEYWKSTPGGKPPRTVVLTDAMAARFVTQAISWLLNVDTKCLPSAEVEQGLAYLGRPNLLAEVSGSLAGLHAAIEFKVKGRRVS
jgi:hypothetical protein